MTVLGTKPVHRISDFAYTRRITKIGLTKEEKKKIKTNCTHCGLALHVISLKKHQLSKRCKNIQLANNQMDFVC
jgi:hypothetical protein